MNPATPPANEGETRTARQRRQRSRSSLLAQGEPMVWLTGGSLVVSVFMIIGLLGLVFAFGLATFWPKPITHVTTLDGRTFMGEVTRWDDYAPAGTYVGEQAEAIRDTVRERLESQSGATPRRLFRTGNFRLTQRHFHWVDEVLVENETYPEWAVALERLEWGRFYGFPEGHAAVTDFIPSRDARGDARPQDAIYAEVHEKVQRISERGGIPRVLVRTTVEGRDEEILLPPEGIETAGGTIVGVAELHEGAKGAWEALQDNHEKVRRAWKKRRHIEKHVIGEINRLQEAARLAVRDAELALEDATRRFGSESTDAREYRAALAAAQGAHEAARETAEEEYQRVRVEIDWINQQNGRVRLVMRTAGEDTMAAKETLIRLDDIVRAYPANQLSTGEKLGVYFSRWGEFLAGEPREANSEGGVFPAIFGTVIMTFVMILVVVPFGVLASLYLREYAKAGPIVSAVRIAVNNLAGVPSIVFGVFGLGFFCYGVGSYIDGGPSGDWTPAQWFSLLAVWGIGLIAGLVIWTAGLKRVGARSPAALRALKGIFLTLWVGGILAGAFVLIAQVPFFDGFYRSRLPNPTFGKGGLVWASLTLALLTLPVVIVATEEALSAVPNSMREGSYACGASKWQTIKRIVLPRAMPGIMTGMVLAMARGAGEVAPLMLVGAVKLAPELPLDGVFPFLHGERSFMHLGFHIYDVGFQSQNSEAAKPMVYTTTMLLITLVVTMNLLAIWLRNRLGRRFKGQAF